LTQTAAAWLAELTDFYTPSATEFDAARRHRASIEARLDAYLGVLEVFEIGSLRHGTDVWYYSDADFLVSHKGIRPGSSWTTKDLAHDGYHASAIEQLKLLFDR